ncbi:MAG TPA: hypothetical protein VGN81_14805 [Pseudonocardiaceae bacterium]|jgi:hypothetical protein
MITVTERRIRADRWQRAQVLVAAAAMAIAAATLLSRSDAQIPVTIGCFALALSPIVVPRADHFRTACLAVGSLMLVVSLAAFLWLFLYAVFYVTPVLSVGIALLAAADRPEERTGPIPVPARLMLVVVAVSVGAAYTWAALASITDRTPIGMAGWGALALLPVLFRDRLGFRIAGLVAGFGLLAVYLTDLSAIPVPAAGIAVVLVCCGESRATRVMAMIAIGVGWLTPLILLIG